MKDPGRTAHATRMTPLRAEWFSEYMAPGCAGAPGWSNSSTRMVTPQRPNEAPSTSSQGDVYVSSTFQVPDGSQCGGTGGAVCRTLYQVHTVHLSTYASLAAGESRGIEQVLWQATYKRLSIRMSSALADISCSTQPVLCRQLPSARPWSANQALHSWGMAAGPVRQVRLHLPATV